MAGIIEKRVSLHRQVKDKKQENEMLRLQVGELQGLANIGEAMCMAAHEINNLLVPLAGYAQLALKNPDDSALANKALTKTAGNCQRAAKVLESMVAFANGQSQHKETCRLKSLVDEIFTCLCRDFSRDRITVSIEIDETLTAQAVPVQLQQVLMNLILNGRAAMLPGGGRLTIKAGQDIDSVWVDIIDTGCGIEAEVLPKIFEPFFTTKTNTNDSQQTGTGLGLAFCKQIVESHNGTISAESEPGKKTKFRIILPKD